MPATAIKTTHNIKCLIFEFTKPPGPYFYRRRRARCPIPNSLTAFPPPEFAAPWRRPASAAKRAAGPNCLAHTIADRVRHNRPMTALPTGNPRFLEESFDLFLAGAALGPIPVARSPVPYFQRTGQDTPVYPTRLIIIYGIRGALMFPLFQSVPGKSRFRYQAPLRCRARERRNRTPRTACRTALGTRETKPIERSLDLHARRLHTPVSERRTGHLQDRRNVVEIDTPEVAFGPFQGVTHQPASHGKR